MPLFSKPFAMDTESDVYVDGEKKTRLVQICPVDAVGLDDVRMFYGWDALSRFMDSFEETNSKKALDCHVFNLGGYEFSHLWLEVLKDRYEYVDKRTPAKGQWTAIADDKTVYKVLVRNQYGTVMKITDDMRRMGNCSMKKASESIRVQHPEWFEGMKETKLESDYHPGWLDESDEGFADAIAYSVQDAYSQAMIARWLLMNGYGQKLTAPSTGLEVALSIKYSGKSVTECTGQDQRFAMANFTKRYPPLNREMQDVAERSLLGGFVWGETGTWHGTFCHIDYSSSYPYEYAYGNMFYGRVSKVTPDSKYWDMYMHGDVFRWFVVSFDFEYIEGMMGCISGRECVGNMTGRMNKKMRTGRVEHRLYTETYLEELKHHYRIENLVIEEMWFAKPCTGDFKDFIQYCYEKKQSLKEAGFSDSADYLMWKLFMNGGFHGKSITRTRRKKKTYFNGEVQTVEEVTEPKLNFMIGFTAMMNARERLLRHCRMVLESGKRVMMCDTDSMVVNCSADEIQEIIGDWFEIGGSQMEGNLGRFEIETDKKALKKLVAKGELTKEQMDEIGVSAEFDEFRCWGLKRYCEVRNTRFGRLFRKSAFAGMHDEEQKELMDYETDGREYEWMQSGKKTMKYGATIVEVVKHMKAENIWDEGEIIAGAPTGNRDFGKAMDTYARIKEARRCNSC